MRSHAREQARTPRRARALSDPLAATGGVLVEAGPGTGKTQLLARRVASLIAGGTPGARILVLTFSRRAAAELRDRIGAGTDCEVRTFHGFASRALEASGPRFRSRRVLDAFADALVLRYVTESATLATFDAATQASVAFRADAARFAADLRRADDASVTALRAAATPRIADLIRIADDAAACRERLRASDLDDLTARLVAALDDPASASSRWLAGRYDHLLVDEFQDVDRLQIALCERIGATVFAVGDPAQAIYRFRGAAHGAFEAGEQRLGLQRFALDESRRCPQIVCDLAARTPLVGATPMRSTAGRAGSIEVRAARTTLDEAALVADRVERALADGVRPEQIAVLVRAMRPVGRAVAAELAARRIAVAGTDPEDFFADPAVARVRLALRALARPDDREHWLALADTLALGLTPLELRLRLRGERIGTLDEARAILERLGAARAANAIQTAAKAFATNDVGTAARTIVRELGIFETLVGGEAAAARVSIARVAKFVDAIAGAQRTLRGIGAPVSSAEIVARADEHVAEIGSDETPPDDAPGVRVLTIHGAKGLQFELVIVADAADGRLPASPRTSMLFDEPDGTALRGAGIVPTGEDPAGAAVEEASLWYVAVTRTRDALFVSYATSSLDGSPQRPSRFIPASLLPAGRAFERSGARTDALALATSSEPAAVAALEALASASPIARAIRRDGRAAFAELPETPVVVPGPLGVTAAGTWLACPRKFYYRHALGLDDDGSVASTRGSLVHRVLARFHDEVTHLDAEAASDVDAWRARLHELVSDEFATAEFAFASEREAAIAVTGRQMARYAEALAAEARRSPFDVVATELGLEVALPSGSLSGRADRLDRRAAGGYVVRDYKSGKFDSSKALALNLSKATKEPMRPGEIDGSLNPQLPLYRIAVEATGRAPVTELSLAYLKGKPDADEGCYDDRLSIDEETRESLERLAGFVDREFVRGFATGTAVPMTSFEGQCTFCTYALDRLCDGAGT